MEPEELYRFCSECGIVIWYKTEGYFRTAIKKNSLCVDCGTKRAGETLKKSGKMAGKNNNMYGRSPSHIKPIYYKNLILRSSYELEFVKRLEDLNIKFEYEPKRFILTEEITYLPDFYLPDYDKWIEIKGWIRDIDLKKT